MPSSYTDSLRLVLPVTGELTGTWGDTVNVGLTALLDAAVAGTAAVVHDDSANYTLTSNNGAADEARRMFLNVTGTLTAARNVVCPTASKLYFIKNATTGGFALTLKTSAGTGISVPNGKSMVLRCDGTNVVEAVDQINALTVASLVASTAAINGGSITGITDLAIADGGTAASTANAGFNNLAPTQTSNAGKYLSTDGTNTSWAAVDALPSQTGNNGKYLTTDGTDPSWATLDTDANQTTKGMYIHANTITADTTITTGNNAISSWPLVIADGVTVTVEGGSRWAIV